jgi:hypothetical protein
MKFCGFVSNKSFKPPFAMFFLYVVPNVWKLLLMRPIGLLANTSQEISAPALSL